MVLAFAIAFVQQATFLACLIGAPFFTEEASGNAYNLMLAVAFFSTFLSIPAFIWNIAMIKGRGTKRDIASAIVAGATFLSGVGYLIFAFVVRVHAVGGRVF